MPQFFVAPDDIQKQAFRLTGPEALSSSSGLSIQRCAVDFDAVWMTVWSSFSFSRLKSSWASTPATSGYRSSLSRIEPRLAGGTFAE